MFWWLILALPAVAVREASLRANSLTAGSFSTFLEVHREELQGDAGPPTLKDVTGKNSFNEADDTGRIIRAHSAPAIPGNTHGRNFHPHRKKAPHTIPVAKLMGAEKEDGKVLETSEEKKQEDGKDAGEEEGEDEEEPWTMTLWDKVLLEVGWLFGFIGLVILLITFMTLVSSLRDGSKDVDDGPVEPGPIATKAYWFHVHVMDPIVVVFGFANFIVFAAATELSYDDEARTGFGIKKKLSAWVPQANEALQAAGAVVLLCSLLLRIFSAQAHPWWKQYRSLAPLVALLLNIFAWMDVIAVTPSLMDLIIHADVYYNIQAISLIRLVEMAVRTPSSTGAGIKAFIDVFDEDGALISTIFALGLVVWIFFSGLYMVANRSNPASEWEAAAYQGVAWQRFESIPSSMFFTLLNLCKEHPLADAFGGEGNSYSFAIFQRMIIIVVCIVGVPVFGVPTGILGASLMKHCKKEVERMKAEAPAEVQEEEPTPEAGLRPIEEQQRPAFLAYTLILSFGSTFVYFFYTLNAETRMFFIELPPVSANALALVEFVTSVFFMAEFIWRAVPNQHFGGKRYFLSMLMLVDLLAFLPGLLAVALFFFRGRVPAWLQGLCVLRVLKPERYIGAFASMWTILAENAAILKATALTSFLLWLLVSSLLHFTERQNPEEELQETYASVPRALWAEIINLHGEWPWCDYTWQGKAIGTFLNFMSIGICMVPVVVFSDAFMSHVEQKVGSQASSAPRALQDTPPAAPLTDAPSITEGATAPKEGANATEAGVAALESGEEEKVWHISQMAEHRWQLRFKENHGFKLLYAHLLSEKELKSSLPNFYYLLRILSTLFILVGTINTIVGSLESFEREKCAKSSQWKSCRQMNDFFLGADISLTVFFIIEFLLRVVVLRGNYLISFIGWVDVLSLSAFLWTLTPARHDQGLHPNYELKAWSRAWVDLILTLRLMRLMMLESWTPALQSLGDVVWIRAPALRKACYALVAVWYMFTVCLYVIEKDSNNDVSERFANVLVGLPHGLIHLTGDYPCTEYRSVAMPFHLVFLILGMCCTGTFTGIFAGGFVEYLGAQRAMERHEAKEERLRVMAMAVCVLQRRFRARRRRLEAAQPEPPQQVSMAKAARRLLRRQTSLGRVFMALAQAALVINICNTMLESIPEIEAMGVEARSSLTLVEIVTGTIFVIEFLLHFISKPTGVFTTPMRFIDFVCLFPTFLRIYFQTKSLKDQLDSPGMEAFIECVAACRVVRVLDWPQIRREVLAVKQTLKAALPSLAMPAVISLQLWVLTAGIFVWLENMYHEHDQPSDQDQMQSIPDALYWCSIYLLGEWANDEFTDGAGSRMCIFYCLCGVALFSIPVGIMVEAGRATLEKVADERKELAELKSAASKRPKVVA